MTDKGNYKVSWYLLVCRALIHPISVKCESTCVAPLKCFLSPLQTNFLAVSKNHLSSHPFVILLTSLILTKVQEHLKVSKARRVGTCTWFNWKARVIIMEYLVLHFCRSQKKFQWGDSSCQEFVTFASSLALPQWNFNLTRTLVRFFSEIVHVRSTFLASVS